MKTYACPYCGKKLHRNDLAKHLEKEHDDELPVNYTGWRLAYDIVNNKPGHGTCTECGSDTTWNEKRQKYNRLCGKKECYEKVRKRYAERMIKVYGKTTLLDDPKQQEKMLANRRISGKYKWSDGKEFTYTGSYEKELLEFLDKVMEYNSDEVIAPGPTLEYTYNGEKHHWITDVFLIPNQVIIEVKDGGDNPNKRVMTSYREKQVAKEKMITNMGTFSYIRLTNNNFAQLMSILAELKMNIVEEKEGPIYRIHESTEDDDTLLSEVASIEASADGFAEYLKSFKEAGLCIAPSGHYEDDPENNVTYYESVILSTPFRHAKASSLFESIVLACVKECQAICPNEVYWKWINPFNHTEGASIGVRTLY